MKFTIAITAISGLSLSACSSAPQEPLSTPYVQAAVQIESAQVAVSQVAGYVHQLATSHFDVGASASDLDEFKMHKVVGASGTFATLSSGLAIALSDAKAPVRQRGPLSGGAAAHNAAVQNYFTQAGIPVDQIAAVKDFGVMGAGGQGGTSTGQLSGTIQYWNSMITRQINGIPVPDSFAWAHLNEDGAVVEESVYWPPIPTAVVQQAMSYASQLSTSAALASYRTAINQANEGVVCIRHSPGEWPNSLVVQAVYDVVADVTLGMPKTLHFDVNANHVTLPFDAPGAWGPEAAASSKKI
jgi:hypothetical protein